LKDGVFYANTTQVCVSNNLVSPILISSLLALRVNSFIFKEEANYGLQNRKRNVANTNTEPVFVG